MRPSTTSLEGVATVRALALAEVVERVQLDLYDLHEVLEVRQGEQPIDFERIEQGLVAKLARPAQPGEAFDVTVHYRGQPEGKGFDGFHWETSEDGSPWINTSCQGLGAHYWYPCKASYFHPEDKPARVSMAITCPAELYGVSNGRLIEVVDAAPAWFATKGEEFKTYRWEHGYPLETYSVTLNVGPYVVVESELELRNSSRPQQMRPEVIHIYRRVHENRSFTPNVALAILDLRMSLKSLTQHCARVGHQQREVGSTGSSRQRRVDSLDAVPFTSRTRVVTSHETYSNYRTRSHGVVSVFAGSHLRSQLKSVPCDMACTQLANGTESSHSIEDAR